MQGTSKSPATSERISFSSDSVGDGFVGFLKCNGIQDQKMLDAVDFVSSPSFVGAFGSAKIVNLALELISMYPKSAKTTQALLRSLCGTPTIARLADLVEKLPDNFFESLPDGLRETVALAFRDSLNQEVAETAIRFCKSPEVVTEVSLPSSTVCLADIFNENVQEIIDNQNRLQSFIEQLGPLSAKDIADFIANLADEHNEVIKVALANHDKSSLLPLLRVLKTPRISVEDIISSFDKERLEVTSQASIQFLLSAVKEVSGAKTVPMLPFLGKWKNPKTQIQLISLIVSFGQTLVSFPKPEQISRVNSVIIGDFKSDLWRSSEFLMSLAYLYDFLPDSVDALLQEYSSKGPALLLLVLAQTSSACPFASHLARLLFLKQSQYMAGFSALWATNPKFLADVILSLYNQRPQMLGRFCDLVDDLCVFDEFLELSPLLFKVLLHVSAFFRRGNDLEKGLKGLYEKDKTVLECCFNVFENPLQYGLSAPMKTERRIGGNEQTFSADMLFFRFLDQIYAKLDDSCKKRVVTMFSKLSMRTPTLTKCTFSWSSGTSPQLPKASMPVSEGDYLKLAVATKPDDIKRFQITVSSLLTNIPRERAKAEGNGKALGRLLAGDLLSQMDSTKALQLIDNGLNQKENSPGFAFAIAALKEMKDSFDIYIPFTNYIIGNAKLRKHAPDIHQAAVTACEPKSVMRPLRDNMDASLPLAHDLERFRDIELRGETLNFDRLNTDVTQWDNYALLYVKNEISRMFHFQSQQNPKFIATCVEACLYLVHKMITSPDARRVATRIALVRLGQWLGQHTLRVNRPVFARLLDISQLLLYSYSHSVLSSAIPFVYMLLKEASDIFKPPNAWTVHILSILSASIRLPYLRDSIHSTIISIFDSFHLSPVDVEPYPLLRLNRSVAYDNDFFYPPFDFSATLSSSTAQKLFDGDLTALFHVVHNHIMIPRQREELRSRIAREVVIFAYTKVPAIATSAAMTAFSLVLKDFARSSDYVAVKRYSKALLIQLINGLSMMAVALINDPCETEVDYAYRSVLNANMKWVDLLVRQLAYHIAEIKLRSELEPIQKLRQTRDAFWDVKSFPPAISMRLPPQLWPQEAAAGRVARTPAHESSLMATGLYACTTVDRSVKVAYSNFTRNPLSITVPDVHLSELPINLQLVRFIFGNFVFDDKGEIVNVKRAKPGSVAMTMPPITTVATLVYCFQPTMPKIVGEYGAELVNDLLGTIDEKSKPALRGQIHYLLAQQMPDMRVYAELVRCDLVEKRFVEILAMNFIDSSRNCDANYAPLVDLVFDLIQRGRFGPSELERLLCFLCTRSFERLSRACSDHLQSLRTFWSTYSRKDMNPTVIYGVKHERAIEILRSWSTVRTPDIPKFIQNFLQRDYNFLPMVIISSYPSHKRELLTLIIAAVDQVKARKEEVTWLLRSFLNNIFTAASTAQISMNYFVSIVSHILLQFRVASGEILTLFGGFVKDLLNFHRFVEAALSIFPLAIQPLLLEDDLKGPTSRLVVSVLMILSQFPPDWDNYHKFRNVYKSILRIILLICHDAPNFVAGYYFDFISVVPIRFKKLRNIILSCCPPSGSAPLMSPFLSSRIESYDVALHNSASTGDQISKMLQDWMNMKQPLEVEIGQFLLYAFKDAHERGIQFDERTPTAHPLWKLANLILLACKTAPTATTVIESLFDQVRYPCLQTQIFTTIIVHLWHVELNWDGITIQDIIYDVITSRTSKMLPVPPGCSQILATLSPLPDFKSRAEM